MLSKLNQVKTYIGDNKMYIIIGALII
ncbi:competence protein ComE, partial [Staphylococcus warneri]